MAAKHSNNNGTPDFADKAKELARQAEQKANELLASKEAAKVKETVTNAVNSEKAQNAKATALNKAESLLGSERFNKLLGRKGK